MLSPGALNAQKPEDGPSEAGDETERDEMGGGGQRKWVSEAEKLEKEQVEEQAEN